ncbi:hypothetical protein JAAARDRAFT_39282 [Jaapia argillacea MUCL 33604]|uniref:Amidohydrolase-related domain-containing protein n=1 Tax=Jaapia argillacea MUCL 33604 TaxID=933084 RepID=A0A067PFA2_9AGAM|nr:hypothetical protein JAAARDRAFT_39282 [Jaapia argillacea MUCL 33604]
MSTGVEPSSPSRTPGLSTRRKGLKVHPKLPLSAFSPPNSGTGEKFPLPPSPSTVHPESVVDADVVLDKGDDDLTRWKNEISGALGDQSNLAGLVVSLKDVEESQIQKTIERLESLQLEAPLLSVIVPFSLNSFASTSPPSYLLPSASSKIPIALSTTLVSSPITTTGIEAVEWALVNDRVLDLHIHCDLVSGETGWEAVEDLLTKAAAKQDVSSERGTLVLSNVLPPPHDLSLPLVKLLTHSTYRAYQSRTASISLHPNLYMKYLPPSWDRTAIAGDDAARLLEWKRRVKMYLGHAVEAFGTDRIIFGSSPSDSTTPSGVSEWYELARESLTELGIDQEGIDAVFGGNALKVYGRKKEE